VLLVDWIPIKKLFAHVSGEEAIDTVDVFNKMSKRSLEKTQL
jgi:hypothetical protein